MDMKQFGGSTGQSQKLRIILHVGGSYPGDGPESKRMRAFCEAFTANGHQVRILAPPAGKKTDIPDYVCLCPAVPLKSKSSVNRLLNGLSFGLSSVWKAAKLGKADIVITTCPPPLINPFGWLIAKCKGARLVYDVRDIWPDVAWEMGSFSKDSIYGRVFSLIRDFMLKHADMTTAVSSGKVQKLRGYCPRAEVLEIPNGFDIHFLENRDCMETAARFHMNDVFTCVYVGNLGLAQGLEQLLYVARRAKSENLNAQFLLFGSGAAEAKLKQYAEQYKLDNVRFPGRLSGEEVYTVLKHAGMSFVPLVNDRLKDSIPTKLYEALGVGCPVLLVAVGDAEELLRESGLGLAVRPNDKEALWDGFLRMYQSKDVFMDNREKARVMMRTEHSLQRSAEKLEKELVLRYGTKETAETGLENAGAA